MSRWRAGDLLSRLFTRPYLAIHESNASSHSISQSPTFFHPLNLSLNFPIWLPKRYTSVLPVLLPPPSSSSTLFSRLHSRPRSSPCIMTARIQAPPRRRRRTSHHRNLITPTTLQRIQPSTAKPVAIAWSPSGNYLAVATQHGPIFLFYVLNATNHVIRPNPIRTFHAHTADVLHMSFSPFDFLLTASMDRSVRLWHPDTNICLRTFFHSDMVTTALTHPLDHNFVLTAGCDGVVRIWRLSDHACVAHADVGAVVTAAQFTSDGTRAFVGTYDGRVLILDVRHAVQGDSKHFTSASQDMNALVPCQTSTENFAVTSSMLVLKTVCIRQRRSRRKSPGPKVGSMCVRAQDKQTVVVTNDARVHLLGKEGEVVNRLKAGARKEGTVPLGSSISPDGRYMLHDAVGGVVRMLDFRGGQKVDSSKRRERNIKSLPIVNEGNVSCAAFASAEVLDNMRPDRDNSDRYLMAIGVDDGSVRLVECSPFR